MALMLNVPILSSLEITTTLLLWAVRMAFFQICVSDTGLNDDELVEPPAASENLIPGVLNSFAQVDEESNLMRSIALTCVGGEGNRD
jgi:hypothetical protein